MLQLLHRRELLGAAAGDLDQLAVAHAPHQRLAAATGQSLAGIVEGEPRIAQRRRAGGQPRVAGQRVQGQHRFGRQLRPPHFAEHLRQRHPRGQPATRQAAAQAPAVLVLERGQFQPARFLGGGVEQADGGAFGIEIPQAVDAQQPLAVRQHRLQTLAAVGLHLPVPVERVRLATRQPQSGQAAEKARRGVENFGQQGVADMTAEPRVAAALAHAQRQPEQGRGQPLLVRLQRGLHQMPAVQRHRARVMAVLGLRQQHRRHVQPGEGGALLRQHLQKEAEHAVVVGHHHGGRRQQPAPRQRQALVAAGQRVAGVLLLVRLLHAHAIRGDNQNTELSSARTECARR